MALSKGSQPKMACPECGLLHASEDCPFCERYDAVLGDSPDAGNIVEFWEAVP